MDKTRLDGLVWHVRRAPLVVRGALLGSGSKAEQDAHPDELGFVLLAYMLSMLARTEAYQRSALGGQYFWAPA